MMADQRNDPGYFSKLFFLEASGGHRRRSQTDAAGVGRFFFIKRNRILVDGDVDLIELFFQSLAGDA